MANFKTSRGNDWGSTPYNSLIDNDPQIVKVPMETVDWGARRGAINRAKKPESGGNGRMTIKHVGGSK